MVRETYPWHENSGTAQESYFWATHNNAELDLLILQDGKRLGYEIKYTDRPSPTRSMRIALEDLHLDHLTIIYPGDKSFPIEDKITAAPLTSITVL